MTNRRRLMVLYGFLAALSGIICGFFVQRSAFMSRITERHRVRSSFVVSYGCCFPDKLCRDHALDSVGALPARDGGIRLLCEYSSSLRDLAGLIDGFREAIPATSLSTLPAAARSLIPGVVGVNSAYLHLSMGRYPLSAELALSTEPQKAAEVVCAMQEAERFQWTEYRTQLNELLVPVLAVWTGTGGSDSLAAVKSHMNNDTGSSSNWEALATTLRGEAKALVLDIGRECTGKTNDAAGR